MSNIPVGTTHSETIVVDATNIASAVGSGMVDFFATPMMIALMELSATRCIAGFLDDGQVSVGTHVGVEHTSPTPIGMKVTAIATVTAVDQRRVEFAVVATDERSEIGRGNHTRFIVDKAKFTEKGMAKKLGTS